MNIRKLIPHDCAALAQFFANMPEDDLTFFKERRLDEATARAWVDRTYELRLVAVDDQGGIAGFAAVVPGTGQSRHVGEVLLVVAVERRKAGVGRTLAERALLDAVRELSLSKLFVEVVATHEDTIRMFRKLGFAAEAILRDHLQDSAGIKRDLILLAHLVDENWEGMTTLGIESAEA